MTGETHGPADEDNVPSLDPRDPRGETDPLTDLPPRIQGALGGDVLDEERRRDLTRLIADALRPAVERQELGLIGGGHTSEDAARIMSEELERRRRALLDMMPPEHTGEATTEHIPGEPGQLPPPAGPPPEGTIPNPPQPEG